MLPRTGWRKLHILQATSTTSELWKFALSPVQERRKKLLPLSFIATENFVIVKYFVFGFHSSKLVPKEAKLFSLRIDCIVTLYKKSEYDCNCIKLFVPKEFKVIILSILKMRKSMHCYINFKAYS